MHETWRQVVHLTIGLAISVSVAVFPGEWTIPFYAGALLVGSAVTDMIERGVRLPLFSTLIDKLEREDSAPGRGAYFFFISTLGCLVLFDPNQAATGIFILAVLDSVATMVGRRFGRHPIYRKKTIEGFLAGTLVTAGALLFWLPPGAAFLTAITAGIVELVSPVDDNLVIPPATCLILSLAG
jgi:dolichol kinase